MNIRIIVILSHYTKVLDASSCFIWLQLVLQIMLPFLVPGVEGAPAQAVPSPDAFQSQMVMVWL